MSVTPVYYTPVTGSPFVCIHTPICKTDFCGFQMRSFSLALRLSSI